MATNVKFENLKAQIVAGGSYTSGTPVKIGTALFAIPEHDASSGEVCAVHLAGVATLPNSGAVFAVGAKVYWSGSACTDVATDSLIGVCTKAAGGTDATVEVLFNGQVVSQADIDAIAAAFGGSATAIGFAKITGAATGGVHKVKFDGTAAPGVTNDLDEGYHVGALWFDTTNKNLYMCADASDGAAVWLLLSGNRGTGTVTIPNASTSGTASVGTAYNGKTVFCSIKQVGANSVGIHSAVVAAGTLTVTLSGDPGVGGAVVGYQLSLI